MGSGGGGVTSGGRRQNIIIPLGTWPKSNGCGGGYGMVRSNFNHSSSQVPDIVGVNSGGLALIQRKCRVSDVRTSSVLRVAGICKVVRKDDGGASIVVKPWSPFEP